MQRGKVHHTGMASIVIEAIAQIAQTRDIIPAFGSIPHLEPMGKTLLTLAAEHAVDLGVTTQILRIVVQELGTAQDDRRLWQQGLHSGNDV